MNHMVCGQFAAAGERGLSNFHRTVCVTFFLDRRSSTGPDSAGHSSSKDQIVVCSVDDGVNILLDEIAGDDQDSRRRQSITSSTLSSNCARVAAAMPLSPIAEIVSDAHATPHTNASRS